MPDASILRRTATRGRHDLRYLAAALLVLGTAGCRGASGRSVMEHARNNEEALGEAVLEALAQRDRVALQGVLVSREEYQKLLWPEMPDKQYTPFDFVWSLNEANNRKGLRQLFERYGGVEFELVSVDWTEPPEDYATFRLYPGAQVTARRLDSGEKGVLPSFEVFVEYAGGWKLLNYDEL